jgi:transposase-like protein
VRTRQNLCVLVLIGTLIRWSLLLRKRAMLIKLTTLLDEAKCYEVIRQLRWPDGVVWLHCRGTAVVRNGHDDRERSRQRYLCKTCKHRFDDLTGTVLAGHHQPVSTWILGSSFMGVNLSNRQIAHELGLCESDAQAMTEVLRHGIVAKPPEVVLSGDIEFDELYVVAGHKGNPEAVRAKGRDGRRNRLKGIRGRGTLEKEKPPIFGMIEREVVIRMLVQQAIRSSRSQRLARLY